MGRIGEDDSCLSDMFITVFTDVMVRRELQICSAAAIETDLFCYHVWEVLVWFAVKTEV